MARHTDFGKEGEELAAVWLARKGYEILQRNWRHGRYEVDIIACYQGVYHFIEVKSGRSGAYGHPEERVNKNKLRNIMQGAGHRVALSIPRSKKSPIRCTGHYYTSRLRTRVYPVRGCECLEESGLRAVDLFHNELHYAVSRGAIFDILFVHVHIIHHPLFGMVREAGTIPGADRIDVAHIGLQVQELAGLFHIHPIPALVFIQPFFPEFFFRHAQVFRDPQHILSRVCGGHGLTTVGAVQAIRFRPGRLVSLYDHLAQGPAASFFSNRVRKLFTALLIVPGTICLNDRKLTVAMWYILD